MDVLKQFDNASFSRDVLDADIPVLVAFTANWCEICQKLLPVLEKTAQEYTEELVSGWVDGDANYDLLVQLNVKKFPTLLFFIDGEEVARSEGVHPDSALKDWVQKNLQYTCESE